MYNTFRVLFYVKRNAPKKNGLIPVMCRITINGKISQFSCKLEVDARQWNTETGRISGRSLAAIEGNRKLDKIRLGIEKSYQEMMEKEGYVTAEKVRNLFLGLDTNPETLLGVFRRHNEEYSRQVGQMKSKKTYEKHCAAYRHLKEFVQRHCGTEDIVLKELRPGFIFEFELFLRAEKHHCTNTVCTYMMPLKSVINFAVNNGWLRRNPFFSYKIAMEETHRGFLTKDEITKLIEMKFPKKHLELVRDLFIFCTFCGLSWTDMARLTGNNLEKSGDGHLWIRMHRQKTGVESIIRLLDVPVTILNKYKDMARDGKLLPVPSYQTCLRNIKQIARECGIFRRISWHLARHSYATTICLSHGVPIETLSKMLGHTNIRTTQIYAKITADKINADVEMLSKQIGAMQQIICNTLK